MGSVVGDRAVVLGGSVTGLWTAAVLANHYREVVVVDRDKLVGVKEWRKGAPQTRHINGLIARGSQALEEILPGITAEMVADGVPISDLAGTVRWYFNGRRLKQEMAGLSCVAATRPVMEFYVRRRVAAIPNVTIRENTDVVGLLSTADNSTVTGARIHPQGGSPEEIEADLVVDCLGRGSRSPVWLDQLGYGRVREDGTKVGLAYASRHYVLRTDPFGTDHSINPAASAALPRGAIFTKTDSGTVELTVYGILGDHPPTDPEGFNAFVKTLAAPEIHETIVDAEPLDDVGIFKFPTTMWRRYDLLPNLPGGYLLLGDAVCTPNPIYAQAQTLAALEVLKLREHLTSGRVPQTYAFQQDVAKIIAPAFAMTTAIDLSFPGVPGKRTPQIKISHWFSRQLTYAASQDSRFTAAWMTVAGLVAPPESLMKPKVFFSVLAQRFRRTVPPTPKPPIVPVVPADRGQDRAA